MYSLWAKKRWNETTNCDLHVSKTEMNNTRAIKIERKLDEMMLMTVGSICYAVCLSCCSPVWLPLPACVLFNFRFRFCVWLSLSLSLCLYLSICLSVYLLCIRCTDYIICGCVQAHTQYLRIAWPAANKPLQHIFKRCHRWQFAQPFSVDYGRIAFTPNLFDFCFACHSHSTKKPNEIIWLQFILVLFHLWNGYTLFNSIEMAHRSNVRHKQKWNIDAIFNTHAKTKMIYIHINFAIRFFFVLFSCVAQVQKNMVHGR